MAVSQAKPFFLAGERARGAASWPVRAPDGERLLAEVSLADAAAIERAIAAAYAARAALAAEALELRQARLLALAGELERQAEDFAAVISAEAGKPLRYARSEAARAARTFGLAAQAAGEGMGERTMELGGGRSGVVRRVPVGVCAFITPFNFPLNLGAHKVAPALAAGCPFVWKPAEKTPLTALLLGELLAAVAPPLPPGAWSILPALPRECGPLTGDPRVRHLSFTGSAEVGWELKRRAQHATVTLELGGNAAAILCEDWDFEAALDRCAAGAFAYSGQVCISLQRLLVPRSRLDEAARGLARRAAALHRGPVADAATEIGPMIHEEAARRVEVWIQQAVAAGATVHAGGRRDGSFVEATVVSGVPHDQPLWREEVFGPVVAIEGYDDFAEALDQVNDSRYGLQAALFTRDAGRIQQAFDTLEVGQLIVGDAPTFRADEMPYGGVKDSGSGREGLRWAIEAMTEPRLLVQAP